MNKYEVMFIVKPAEEEATNAVIEKVEALIARVGGTVEKVDRWGGKRRLAYAVKKFTDGFYVLINFEAAPAEIKEIDRVLKINDEVLRHLIVKHEA
ncbi:30S ribosomal protein S6 [Veillonella rogosae]|uniref:30S ribosomal protein S6 n=1 Tax=Veillonella rogosae TaxID=423477 RepID=UPI0006D0AAB2|nr:30S ribosomal protein S6 [Veillonella rogosae]